MPTTPSPWFTHPKCSTSNKAKRWLDDNGFEYTNRHIVESNPTYEEIKEWHAKSGLPLKRFFNTSGLLYRNMNLKEKLPEMTEDEQIKLLSTNGMLVKRPVVIDDVKGAILVGFKETEWEEKLKK